jgi:pyruvate formate lyase activating enzyme
MASEKLASLIPLTDTFLYDLKAYDSDVHKRLTGVSNELIIENLRMLDERGARIEIRIPYVPECNADQMEKLARLISSLKHSHPVRLLKYHSHAEAKYTALGMESSLPQRMPTDEEINSARSVLIAHGIEVLT